MKVLLTHQLLSLLWLLQFTVDSILQNILEQINPGNVEKQVTLIFFLNSQQQKQDRLLALGEEVRVSWE